MLEVQSTDLIQQLRRGFGARGGDLPPVWPALYPIAEMGPMARAPFNTFRQQSGVGTVLGVAAQGSFVGIINNGTAPNAVLIRSARAFFAALPPTRLDFLVANSNAGLGGAGGFNMGDHTNPAALFVAQNVAGITGTNVTALGTIQQQICFWPTPAQALFQLPDIELVLYPGSVAGFWIPPGLQVAGSNLQGCFTTESYAIAQP